VTGTVRGFDPLTRDGDVLLDDGSVLAFPGASVQLRGLRSGQRVRLLLDGEHVVGVTIATLPFR
jgi:hypothetical protein